MQVKEVSSEGLVREFKVTVSYQEIEKNMASRLEEIGRTVSMPGFRPGKIPLPVLQKRYGDSVKSEVIEKTVNDTSERAITERSLRIALEPKIELVASEPGKDLEYNMKVEVLPEIKPVDFKGVKLERMTAEVADKEVEDAILRIAKTMRGPEFVKDDRKAVMGDVLVIDFEGEADGTAYPGMKSANHRLELGSKSFIGNFEEQLVGSRKGDKKEVKVGFPDDYHAADLAGKKAVFQVTVKDLMEFGAIAIDDELAKELGAENAADMRERVKEQIGKDYQQIARTLMKRDLMDQLADQHDFEVPQGMIEAEFASIWRRVEMERKRGGPMAAEDKGKSDDELKDDYRDIAERRVRLGLLLAEVGKQNNLKVNEQEMREALLNEARSHPGKEKEVFDFYTQTPGALDRLQAPVLEEKVVDYIFALANITDRKVTGKELMEAPEKTDSADKAKKTKRPAAKAGKK
ncbi:MAG: trigger factor [Alphaproteobacteria bacterium]|nr:trigger factor [Alphaproteobacteria bacterium]